MKKITVRNALFLSAGIVLLAWVIKVVRNICYLDRVIDSFKSLPKIFLEASVVGILTILVVILLLRLTKEKFKDIGFDRQKLFKQIGIGFLFGVLIFALDAFIAGPLLDSILPKTAAKGIDMSKFFTNTLSIPIFVFIAIFKGGFCEELWRIFILTRFEKIFGKSGLIAALILSSVVFGIGHLYQGINGLISIAIIGFLYGLVYLRKRRALEAVLAHATFNTINIILGYVMYHGR